MDSSAAPIVVRSKPWRRHFLFGFLTVAFAAALVRGHLGMTGTGRLVVDVVFGALTAGTIALWTHLARHPTSLEISHDTIRHWHRGLPLPHELLRESGELYIRLAGGKYPQAYLCVAGSEQVGLPLNMFDRTEVIRACEAQGWRFVARG